MALAKREGEKEGKTWSTEKQLRNSRSRDYFEFVPGFNRTPANATRWTSRSALSSTGCSSCFHAINSECPSVSMCPILTIPDTPLDKRATRIKHWAIQRTTVICVIYLYDVQIHLHFVSRLEQCMMISPFSLSLSLSLFAPAAFDRDNRNRRFTVDTFLAMHGPSGPPGLPGPSGSPGPRGSVGAQGRNRFPTVDARKNNADYFLALGMTGRSKEAVPVVAFIAHLQKMLSVESNRSETIVFENAQINEGNGYNPSTGIFTAAHRGIYKFSMTIMAQMDSIVRRKEFDSVQRTDGISLLGYGSNHQESRERARNDSMWLSTAFLACSWKCLRRIGRQRPGDGRGTWRCQRSESICSSEQYLRLHLYTFQRCTSFLLNISSGALRSHIICPLFSSLVV